MSCHMSRTRTDAHHDTPHRTRSLRFVGDWCGCCVLICDWLIEFASNLQTRTAQDKRRSLCVTAVHCLRISQWRLSGLFVLFVWVWFVLSFVWGLFFGGSVLRTECWYRRPDLSWTKESLNKICKISWEGHLLWPDLSAVYASAGCGAFVCADLAFFSFFFFPSVVIAWRYVLVWKAFCSIAPPFVRWWMVAAWLGYAPGGNVPRSLRTMLPKEGIDGVFVSMC